MIREQTSFRRSAEVVFPRIILMFARFFPPIDYQGSVQRRFLTDRHSSQKFLSQGIEPIFAEFHNQGPIPRVILR